MLIGQIAISPAKHFSVVSPLWIKHKQFEGKSQSLSSTAVGKRGSDEILRKKIQRRSLQTNRERRARTSWEEKGEDCVNCKKGQALG